MSLSRMLVRPFYKHSVITLFCQSEKNVFCSPRKVFNIMRNFFTSLTEIVTLQSYVLNFMPLKSYF